MSMELSALHKPSCLHTTSSVKRGSSATSLCHLGHCLTASLYSPCQQRCHACSATASRLMSSGAHCTAQVANMAPSLYFPFGSPGRQPLLWHSALATAAPLCCMSSPAWDPCSCLSNWATCMLRYRSSGGTHVSVSKLLTGVALYMP